MKTSTPSRPVSIATSQTGKIELNRSRCVSYPAWAPWFFIAPFLILFAVFTIYPLFQALLLSSQQTYGPEASQYVGTRNFTYLLTDPLFWIALRNTALFAAGSVFLQLPLSLGLAMWLNHPKVRAKSFFRLIFFTPALFGVVFVAMLFSLIFEKYTGLLNVILHRLVGFPLDFPWLEEYCMAALILSALWMYVGFNMIYFLAALQGVDTTLLEAASIDGANAWQRFLHIVIPAIQPVAAFVVLLSLIGSFQLFELPYLLFNGGGPENRALTVVMYLYQTGFETGDLGYASAIGWVLALILMGFALFQRLVMKRSES
jgi:ABC-type sugar transport system permease subunit